MMFRWITEVYPWYVNWFLDCKYCVVKNTINCRTPQSKTTLSRTGSSLLKAFAAIVRVWRQALLRLHWIVLLVRHLFPTSVLVSFKVLECDYRQPKSSFKLSTKKSTRHRIKLVTTSTLQTNPLSAKVKLINAEQHALFLFLISVC